MMHADRTFLGIHLLSPDCTRRYYSKPKRRPQRLKIHTAGTHNLSCLRLRKSALRGHKLLPLCFWMHSARFHRKSQRKRSTKPYETEARSDLAYKFRLYARTLRNAMDVEMKPFPFLDYIFRVAFPPFGRFHHSESLREDVRATSVG